MTGERRYLNCATVTLLPLLHEAIPAYRRRYYRVVVWLVEETLWVSGIQILPIAVTAATAEMLWDVVPGKSILVTHRSSYESGARLDLTILSGHCIRYTYLVPGGTLLQVSIAIETCVVLHTTVVMSCACYLLDCSFLHVIIFPGWYLGLGCWSHHVQNCLDHMSLPV